MTDWSQISLSKIWTNAKTTDVGRPFAKRTDENTNHYLVFNT